MPTSDETVTVAVEADTSDLVRSMNEVQRLSQGLGRALGNALDGAVVKGRSLDSVMGTLALRLSDLALKAALKPLDNAIGNLFSGALGGTGAVSGFAQGGVIAPVNAFADGGVVAAPTYFPMARGTGLAGEAGAEAILPLARGSDGRLGVRSQAAAAPVSVVVNIATPDIGSFRQSEAQVSAALARAVARGRRGL